MKEVSSIKRLRAYLAPLKKKKVIGFVPTMGAFHEGHLSLMRKAKRECDIVLVSLFVNPLQFGPQEDYDAYPRNPQQDRQMARAEGIDLLWTPSGEKLLPPGFQTTIDVGPIAHCWEGASRPGHFQGVASLVAKLLLIVRPDRLYLGRKDFQQTRVIAQMVKDLGFGLRIRIGSTRREKDGLAMSSRNQRLSSADRKIAPILYCALKEAKAALRTGKPNAPALLRKVKARLSGEPRIQIDYLALCDPQDLMPIKRIDKDAVLLAAVRIGRVRLIDNILLQVKQ